MQASARWIGGALGLLALAAALPGLGVADDPSPLASVTTDFLTPVALAPLPNGDVLVGALGDGKVWRLLPNNTLSGWIIDLPSSPAVGEFGLLGLTAHPEWPTQPWVYAFYTDPPLAGPANAVGPPRLQRVVRFPYEPGAAEAGAAEDVVTNLTSGTTTHNGGRLAFGPDGMLYVTLGEHFVSAFAQVPKLPPGSILRFTPTGGIPEDNPDPSTPVVIKGLRNPFGLHFDSTWGMVVTDNGPSVIDGPACCDEVNLLRIGDNAGWPLSRGDIVVPGTVGPVWHSGDISLGHTGVTVPRGSRVAAWDGKVLWCSFNDGAARLFDPATGDLALVGQGCRYDVAQDAQGRILWTDNRTIWISG